MSVVPLADNRYPAEQRLVEAAATTAEEATEYSDSTAGHIRSVGNSTFRKEAKVGDIVIEMLTPRRGSKRVRVFPPEPILHRKDNGGVTHFFIEQYVDRDETAVSFTSFSRLWQRMCSTRAPGRGAMRELPVDVLEKLRVSWPDS
jgi:hypothetical protein